ncbi:ABC transporter ATP-binding protein, partial [Micromonospora aurantiaca]|nr:ABC transporter ATP-binding protein [Micromonospora aurantiaca]
RPRLKHRPSELSGGQQQRVACARALASRPEIIFADEPTGNLDSRSGAEVLGFLRDSVRQMGQTIVMVTHDPSAAAYADQVLFLSDGQIVDT